MKNLFLANKILKCHKKSNVMVSFVGGGGKTTTLLTLAHQLKNDTNVLVTTTTAMFHPHETVDKICYHALPTSLLESEKIVALYAGYIEEKDKMIGVDHKMLNTLLEQTTFGVILNEADGARRKPLKCYADHEPVIPSKSHIVIVVIGADAIGSVLSKDIVHRIDEFSNVTGLQIGDLISPEAILKVLTHTDGFLKGIPEKASTYLVINKVLSHPLSFNQNDFAQALFKLTKQYDAVLYAEMIQGHIETIIEQEKHQS